MIWKLGNHILGQGSSLDIEFVHKVIGDNKIRAIVTDPLYGVGYVEGKDWLHGSQATVGAKFKKIEGDQLQSDENYALFTKTWLGAVSAKLTDYNACYIFSSDMMYPPLRAGMKAAGFYYSQMIIWLKNHVVLGRKDYLQMFELIAYGWYGKHKMERSKAKSVLFHPKPARSALHPTMKPVGLLRKILPNSTKAGEWVYDPFLGSGSTLIACEHLGRKCIGIELDENYCKTIIGRWEKLTGGKAEPA